MDSSAPVKKKQMSFIVDFIECQGNKRKYMEDGFIKAKFQVNHPVTHEVETCHVYGVLDGHGGDECMKWLRRFVPERVRDTYSHHECDWTNMCLRMNQEMFEQGIRSGSTMSLVIILVNSQDFYRMCIINVGDSAIAGSYHQPHIKHPWNKRSRACLATHCQLTTNHDIYDPAEKARIDQDNRVKLVQKEYVSTLDKKHGVNMTRAFGDFDIGDTIAPIPQIIYIQKPICFLTLASDGIWDIVTPKDISKWATEGECNHVPSGELNSCLIKQRSKRYQHDNYTLGVMFFNPLKSMPWIRN